MKSVVVPILQRVTTTRTRQMTTDLVLLWTPLAFVVALVQQTLTAMVFVMMQTTAPTRLHVITVTQPMRHVRAFLVRAVRLFRLVTMMPLQQSVLALVFSQRAVILVQELQTGQALLSMETQTTMVYVMQMKLPAVPILQRAITTMQRQMTMGHVNP